MESREIVSEGGEEGDDSKGNLSEEGKGTEEARRVVALEKEEKPQLSLERKLWSQLEVTKKKTS